MPNSRNPHVRELIIDRCLSSGREMTATEIMNEVNNYLQSQGLSAISSKATILRDIYSICERWNVELSKNYRDNTVYYKYKEPLFSIYKPKIRTEDLEKLNGWSSSMCLGRECQCHPSRVRV